MAAVWSGLLCWTPFAEGDDGGHVLPAWHRMGGGHVAGHMVVQDTWGHTLNFKV